MILGTADNVGNSSTLDSLFRRAGIRGPERLALVDPPDRQRFANGQPRALTFAEADRAISAVAARLRAFGLPTDAVVAVQLGNTVESVVVLLGILRAGMIAAPLPLLWRRQEIVSALGRVGAKAIITAARIGSTTHAEIAAQAAAELFSIRHVCAFGDELPDGVAPLDDCFDPDRNTFVPTPARPGNAAAHVALITFDITAPGLVPIARHHGALIAGGQPLIQATKPPSETSIVSAIVPGSFAAIALTVVPWLLAEGTLHLHHPFDPIVFAGQCANIGNGTIVLPGPALAALCEPAAFDRPDVTIAALWRAPQRLQTETTDTWQSKRPLIDVAAFGELGFVATRRGFDGRPPPLPSGPISVGGYKEESAPVIELRRGRTGTLLLRGAMVPTEAFPPSAEAGFGSQLPADVDDFLDSGFVCREERDRSEIIVTGPPAGIDCVGGYRFHTRTLGAVPATVDPEAAIVALPDITLGQRLAGNARDRDKVRTKLIERGANPLVVGAFRGR